MQIQSTHQREQAITLKKKEAVSVLDHARSSHWPVLLGIQVQMAPSHANQSSMCGKQHVLHHIYGMIGLLHQPFIWISGREGEHT